MLNHFGRSKAVAAGVLTLVLGALAGFTASTASAVGLYRVVDLGTLGGESSAATAINDSGQVVGWSDTANGARRAFLYEDGEMLDLGTHAGGTLSRANRINDHGQVVGESGINLYGPMFAEFSQAFLWRDGQMQSCGALYCPCSFNVRYGTSVAQDINNQGHVVGWSETVRGGWVSHAFVWEDGAMRDIGGGAGDWSVSHAFAINDSGQIVGDFAEDAGVHGSGALIEWRATLWHDAARIDLGTLPGDSASSAYDINDHGDAVGWSGDADGSRSRAFIWTGGEMSDLGALPGDDNSQALGVNNRGQVVGWSGAADGAGSRAFLWQYGVMFDLNWLIFRDSGWEIIEASDINDSGRIVGVGLKDGQMRAVLLEPWLPFRFFGSVTRRGADRSDFSPWFRR